MPDDSTEVQGGECVHASQNLPVIPQDAPHVSTGALEVTEATMQTEPEGHRPADLGKMKAYKAVLEGESSLAEGLLDSAPSLGITPIP